MNLSDKYISRNYYFDIGKTFNVLLEVNSMAIVETQNIYNNYSKLIFREHISILFLAYFELNPNIAITLFFHVIPLELCTIPAGLHAR